MDTEDERPNLERLATAQDEPQVLTPEPNSYAELRRLAAERIGGAVLDRDEAIYRLHAVQVLGTPNTRSDFLLDVVAPALRSPERAPLASILDRVVSVAESLQALGVYERVSAELDAVGGVQDLLSATIRVKEAPRFSARTGTDFGNQEGSAYVSANVRNCFGGAESLAVNASFGTRTRTSYEARYATPVRADPTTVFEVTGFGATRQQLHSSHDEMVQGIQGKLRHAGARGVHECGVQAVHRSIENVRPAAGLAVRLATRASVKHSLTYAFTRDRRDDRVLPSCGHRIHTVLELASNLLGGDAAFLKGELQGSVHTTLRAGPDSLPWLVGLSLRAGAMHALGGTTSSSSYLHDRFSLGGPQTVRGFLANGIGPRSGPDHIGGDCYWAAGLAMTRKLSAALDWPVYGQAFLNAGALALSTGTPRRSADLLRPSASAGLGLVFRHPAARIEVSFCMPLVAGARDRTRKGLQFGIGLDFL